MSSNELHDCDGIDGQCSRRRLLAVTGVVVTSGIAGCADAGSNPTTDASGNDDGGDDSDDVSGNDDGDGDGDADAGGTDGTEASSDGGADETDAATDSPHGTRVDAEPVGESAIDALAIVEHARNDTDPESGESRFRVEVTVENTGEETSGELYDYGWSLQVYDAYGTPLVDEGKTDPRVQTESLDTTLDSGSQKTVYLTPKSGSGFARAAEDREIGWYEFELGCPDDEDSLPYCR